MPEVKIAPTRMMVVEDDIDIVELIQAFFVRRGFEVETFDDAKAAMKRVEDGYRPQVILSDLELPGASGIDVIRQIKKLGLTTPVILITAHNSAEYAVKAVESGAYDFIVKPLHFPQLLVSVHRALHFSRLNLENETLRQAVRARTLSEIGGVIGKSPGFLRALDLAKRVSSSRANIFIAGETGSGKEVLARAIHNFGKRKKSPFVAINCSAIPENLLESELFGHAKGAFTGAIEKKAGLFEEADGGTLLLDEIGDLPLALQAKILRAIQDRKIKRVGENQERKVDVRILSATHKDLREEIRAGRFREDLFFRLNVIQINIPALRERPEDILPLAEHFLRRSAAIEGVTLKGFTNRATEAMLRHEWRGNVRELENKVERAVVLCDGEKIDIFDLFEDSAEKPAREAAAALLAPDGDEFRVPAGATLPTLKEVTRAYIQFALKKNNEAKDQTAKLLGIDRKTLYSRLKEMPLQQ